MIDAVAVVVALPPTKTNIFIIQTIGRALDAAHKGKKKRENIFLEKQCTHPLFLMAGIEAGSSFTHVFMCFQNSLTRMIVFNKFAVSSMKCKHRIICVQYLWINFLSPTAIQIEHQVLSQKLAKTILWLQIGAD